MNHEQSSHGNLTSRRSMAFGLAAALVLVAIYAAVTWEQGLPLLGPDKMAESEMAAPAVVSDFFTSLAALDVEENDRAARLLSHTVESETREPALWANLTVARLRLRDLPAANRSLQYAIELAGETHAVAVLHAEVLEHSGQTEEAIAQFREVHKRWPEDIAATYSFARLLEQMRSDAASQERLDLLTELQQKLAGNVRVLCDLSRLAATMERSHELQTGLDALSSRREPWPEQLQQQLSAAKSAAASGEYRQAATALTFFENVLKPRPEYQTALAELGASGSSIGTPVREFLRLRLPRPDAATPGTELTFLLEALETSHDQTATDPDLEKAARPALTLSVPQAGERRSTLVSLSNRLRAGESAALPFPGSPVDALPASVCLADLNADFQNDLIAVGSEGCRVWLGLQDGTFAPYELPEGETAPPELTQPWRAIWAVDVDADGDLDLLLSDLKSPLLWLRNSGAATFAAVDDFSMTATARQLIAVDLDQDGDIDFGVLEAGGAVSVWQNERSGAYQRIELPSSETPQLALATGDVDRDGKFDLVTLSENGELRQLSRGDEGHWSATSIAQWQTLPNLSAEAAHRTLLHIADVDNNGAVDLVASVPLQTMIWLGDAENHWTALPAELPQWTTSIVDRNEDGRLDLVGLVEQNAVAAMNQSRAEYGWTFLEPQANPTAGDRRINSFGIGGRVEVRAGNQVQAAPITSSRIHFGLGKQATAEVARIVWPNGTMQAEFDLAASSTLVAKQRLKGSCPWVFAFDGREFQFVKDFIWRSPLGLRINAQDTAGVAQTTDWIKVPGEVLKDVDGRCSLRITAELWETHFFDEIALLTVDHPDNVEVFVDERFVPNEQQAREVVVTTRPQTVQQAVNHRGQLQDAALAVIDGEYATDFELGEYQGVAEDHWIEFELPADAVSDRPVVLLGHGWVYPTDSSLNVAIAQQKQLQLTPLILEQQDADGQWRVLHGNLGFPAGKNKNAVIPLPVDVLQTSRRFRLRTNLEIYWDFLGWAHRVEDHKVRTQSTRLVTADLRGRGYSKLQPLHRRRPDTPFYEVESTGPRWLDLEGFHTRFGDVRELVAQIDDRYMIMNAGDEVVLEFAAKSDVPDGWRRDYVLIGDGWVKDGDFNTAFSRTVLPLPSHSDPDYSGPLHPLQQDPTYTQHPDDWVVFHTRYVRPNSVWQGLWKSFPRRTNSRSSDF
ncbi:hypothetical protein GC176_05630 [bacterium]|nr:hypothetical protein [bacterium]